MSVFYSQIMDQLIVLELDLNMPIGVIDGYALLFIIEKQLKDVEILASHGLYFLGEL